MIVASGVCPHHVMLKVLNIANVTGLGFKSRMSPKLIFSNRDFARQVILALLRNNSTNTHRGKNK